MSPLLQSWSCKKSAITSSCQNFGDLQPQYCICHRDLTRREQCWRLIQTVQFKSVTGHVISSLSGENTSLTSPPYNASGYTGCVVQFDLLLFAGMSFSKDNDLTVEVQELRSHQPPLAQRCWRGGFAWWEKMAIQFPADNLFVVSYMNFLGLMKFTTFATSLVEHEQGVCADINAICIKASL